MPSTAKKSAVAKKAAPKRMGRPPRDAAGGEAAAHRVVVRLTDSELETIEAAARAAGSAVSPWIRSAALSSAKKA